MSDRTVPAMQRTDMRSSMITAMVQQAAQKFDPDIWAAMDKRDNALVEDEIIHGVQSTAFVYSIPMPGKRAEGITVVGARQLAAGYGGIHVTLISSLSKRGGVFTNRAYPYGGFPGKLEVQKIPDLEDEEDFYEVTIEVHDIKTGNKIPSSRRELAREKRSEASMRSNPNQDPYFDRPHLEQIAFSKAFRNGVTSILPQDAVLKFKQQNLALNTDQTFVQSVIDEKRAGVLRYAAARAISVDREAVESLTFEQISGLADAAREGGIEVFTQSAQALGIVVGAESQDRPRLVATQTTAKQASNGQQQQTTTTKAATDTKKAETKTADKKADTKPPPAEDKKTTGKQESPPAFDHSALDAMGEDVMDQDSIPIRFTRPGDFALWYRGAWERTKEQNRDALAAHNADALADAALDPAAAVILEALAAKQEEPAKPAAGQTTPANVATREPVALPLLADGNPDWPTYVNELQADLATVTIESEFNAWKVLNAPTWTSPKNRGAKPNFTARIEPLIEAKAKSFEKVESERDHDMERAIGTIQDLDDLQDLAELEAYGKHVAVKRFVDRMKANRPDIMKMLEEANAKTLARLQAAAAKQGEGEEQPKE